ncbi:Uncharacterised protein [Mycobacteroides abscessus subsp. abscessus]|nr:Uncharacterised protein [Mycobacteroides abscessus subsp. abscessus]
MSLHGSNVMCTRPLVFVGNCDAAGRSEDVTGASGTGVEQPARTGTTATQARIRDICGCYLVDCPKLLALFASVVR